MVQYLYVVFFALGPVYWLPGIGPDAMQAIKLALFLMVGTRLAMRWLFVYGARVPRAPLAYFAALLGTMLLSTLFHFDGASNLSLIGNYLVPLAVLVMVSVASEDEIERIVRALRWAPSVFAPIALLVPLGLLVPGLNWVNPYSEALDGFVGTQTFTGFGGSRTGWSLGTSLLMAAAIANIYFLEGRKSRLLAYCVILIIGAAIFIPGGRVGMLAILSMLLSLTALNLSKRSRVKTALLLMLSLVVLTAVALYFAEELRLDALLGGNLSEGTTGRTEGWAIALKVLSENPIFGVGVAGSDLKLYGLEYGAVHNALLNFALRFGMLSTMVLVAMFGWMCLHLHRVRGRVFDRPIILLAGLMLVAVFAEMLTEPEVIFASYYNSIIFWFAFSASIGQKRNFGSLDADLLVLARG